LNCFLGIYDPEVACVRVPSTLKMNDEEKNESINRVLHDECNKRSSIDRLSFDRYLNLGIRDQHMHFE
jgi:hypothetical protein